MKKSTVTWVQPVHSPRGEVVAAQKGKKMPGHYGAARVTVRNLKVVRIDVERNLILVNGAVLDQRVAPSSFGRPTRLPSLTPNIDRKVRVARDRQDRRVLSAPTKSRSPAGENLKANVGIDRP